MAVDSIVESTKYFISSTLKEVQKRVKEVVSGCGVNHNPLINETFANLKLPFDGFDTEKLQISYMKSNFNYVSYREMELEKTVKKTVKYLTDNVCLIEQNKDIMPKEPEVDIFEDDFDIDFDIDF